MVRGLVPDEFDGQVRMVASLAYMARLAMDGDIIPDLAGSEQAGDSASVELEPGGAPGLDRQDREREDVFASADTHASWSFDHPVR